MKESLIVVVSSARKLSGVGRSQSNCSVSLLWRKLSWLYRRLPMTGAISGPFYSPHKICLGFQLEYRRPSPFLSDDGESGSKPACRRISKKTRILVSDYFFNEIRIGRSRPVSNRERQLQWDARIAIRRVAAPPMSTSDKSYGDWSLGRLGTSEAPQKT